MIVIEKTPGEKIEYSFNAKTNKLTLGDDELTLNLSKYERDNDAHIDICIDNYGQLVTGVIPGVAERYAAEIDIPAKRYIETEGEEDADGNPTTVTTAAPFDIKLCTLYLWGQEVNN